MPHVSPHVHIRSMAVLARSPSPLTTAPDKNRHATQTNSRVIVDPCGFGTIVFMSKITSFFKRPSGPLSTNTLINMINRLCEISILTFISDMVLEISKGKNLPVASRVCQWKKSY